MKPFSAGITILGCIFVIGFVIWMALTLLSISAGVAGYDHGAACDAYANYTIECHYPLTDPLFLIGYLFRRSEEIIIQFILVFLATALVCTLAIGWFMIMSIWE